MFQRWAARAFFSPQRAHSFCAVCAAASEKQRGSSISTSGSTSSRFVRGLKSSGSSSSGGKGKRNADMCDVRLFVSLSSFALLTIRSVCSIAGQNPSRSRSTRIATTKVSIFTIQVLRSLSNPHLYLGCIKADKEKNEDGTAPSPLEMWTAQIRIR